MKIAVAQHKGGVGKTTLATHVAGLLSEDDLKKLLLIDCDSQGDSFRFYTGRLPEEEQEIDTDMNDVDVLWNLERASLSTSGAYAEYDNIVVDIDTRIQNALQVITELSPDIILIPVDDQYLSLSHLKDALSLIHSIEGVVSYPAVVKIVQMGADHDLESILAPMTDLPSSLYIGYGLPYLRKAFNESLSKCKLIWNLNEEYYSINKLIDEVISYE
ncbi:MAG: AAA family ATPase [Gammaproteobacteria bacterium]|nr:AAA family ATPase [Gammaproteobacteria bacterium]